MATLGGIISFTDGQTIVASQHNTNFNQIATFVDALSAGTNFNNGAIGTATIADDAVTGPKIAANAVGLSELASAVAEKLVPTGTITAYGGSVPPTGWLLCDGSLQIRNTYSALFNVIGSNYGAGDGSTTFALPNLKGRVAVGFDSTQTEFDEFTDNVGTKTVTLTSAEIPAHTHGVTVAGTVAVTLAGGDHIHGADTGFTGSHNHAQTVEGVASGTHGHGTSGTAGNPTGTGSTGTDFTGTQVHQHIFNTASANAGVSVSSATFTQTSGTANANTGGGGAHNNLQPYTVVNYIIKA